jgi:hypothetical protein
MQARSLPILYRASSPIRGRDRAPTMNIDFLETGKIYYLSSVYALIVEVISFSGEKYHFKVLAGNSPFMPIWDDNDDLFYPKSYVDGLNKKEIEKEELPLYLSWHISKYFTEAINAP